MAGAYASALILPPEQQFSAGADRTTYIVMSENKTILVADDDPDIRVIICGALECPEWSTVQATSGDEAWQQFQAISPDIAILDIMMPGMDGNQVCRRIKESQSGSFVPVIMLTARDDVQDKVGSFEIGADDYVTKPFNYHELRARVKAFLRIRDLNLKLHHTNEQLKAAQEKIVAQERQLIVGQLAGTAAHELGQPLSAILLNCHLISQLNSEDHRFRGALAAIKADAKRMAELIESLRGVDPNSKQVYFGETQILGLGKKAE